jgi:uncharacterized membrane protein YecN with MAPEG domain
VTAPITALYAGLLGLLLVVLGARVSLMRSKLRVGMGHGDDLHLARAIRVHANAVEWILPMLLLFLVAELDGANRIFLHVCGVIFIGARIMHARGISRTSKESPGRFWGMAGTWLVIAALGLWDIAAFARSGFWLTR